MKRVNVRGQSLDKSNFDVLLKCQGTIANIVNTAFSIVFENRIHFDSLGNRIVCFQVSKTTHLITICLLLKYHILRF